MTTINLNLDWLSNEGLAVLLNQLFAACNADYANEKPESRALGEAHFIVEQYLDARIGEDETVQLQIDVDALLDVAAYRHNKRYAATRAAETTQSPAPAIGGRHATSADEEE